MVLIACRIEKPKTIATSPFRPYQVCWFIRVVETVPQDTVASPFFLIAERDRRNAASLVISQLCNLLIEALLCPGGCFSWVAQINDNQVGLNLLLVHDTIPLTQHLAPLVMSCQWNAHHKFQPHAAGNPPPWLPQ